MALLPEDRERIWEEETLRQQAREAIRRQRDSGWLAGLSRQLNTPLAIWLLSSVVIALIALGYSALENRQHTRQERLRQIEALDIELAARIRNFNTVLSKQESVGGTLTDHGVSAYLLEGSNAYSIIPAYRELPLLGLLWKLELQVPEHEKPAIASAAEAARALDVRNFTATQYSIEELRNRVAPLQLRRWVGSSPGR